MAWWKVQEFCNVCSINNVNKRWTVKKCSSLKMYHIGFRWHLYVTEQDLKRVIKLNQIRSHDNLSLVIPNNKTVEHWQLEVLFILNCQADEIYSILKCSGQIWPLEMCSCPCRPVESTVFNVKINSLHFLFVHVLAAFFITPIYFQSFWDVKETNSFFKCQLLTIFDRIIIETWPNGYDWIPIYSMTD